MTRPTLATVAAFALIAAGFAHATSLPDVPPVVRDSATYAEDGTVLPQRGACEVYLNEDFSYSATIGGEVLLIDEAHPFGPACTSWTVLNESVR